MLKLLLLFIHVPTLLAVGIFTTDNQGQIHFYPNTMPAGPAHQHEQIRQSWSHMTSTREMGEQIFNHAVLSEIRFNHSWDRKDFKGCQTEIQKTQQGLEQIEAAYQDTYRHMPLTPGTHGYPDQMKTYTDIETTRIRLASMEEKYLRLCEKVCAETALYQPEDIEKSCKRRREWEEAQRKKPRIENFEEENNATFFHLDSLRDLKKPERQFARELGLISTREASIAYSSLTDQNEEALFYKELGKDFLDIAVGLDPVSGLGRSAYELLSGQNLITGQNLSYLERTMAFVGVISLGGSSAGANMWKVMEKASHLLKDHHAVEMAMKGGERLIRRAAPAMEGFKGKIYRALYIESANDVNDALRIVHQSQSTEKFYEPFQRGSHVIHFETLKDTKWVHFFHEKYRMEGSWVMKHSSVQGLTLEQIRAKYAIPKTITSMANVYVPKGTQMTRGMVEYHNFADPLFPHGESGAVQHILKDFDKRWFSHPRKIEGVVP